MGILNGPIGDSKVQLLTTLLIWAVSDNGSTSALHAESKGSIPLWSTMKIYTNEEMATIKEAAMLASYHLIGVKDQRSMNRMVAQKILDCKKVYDEERDKIKDKELLSALDEYHDIN